MNWKEQFDNQFPRPNLPVTALEHARTIKIEQYALANYWEQLSPAVKHFISTEIIAKLIAEIPDEIDHNDGGGGWINTKGLKQQLRDKWL